MIKSLLDTDLYKLSMAYVYFKKYPNTKAEYKFVCRTKGVDLSFLIPNLQSEVNRIASLKYTPEEINYLRTLNLFDEDFLSYLQTFKLDSSHVTLGIENNQLAIRVSGPILQATPWEIYLLASINELYFTLTYPDLDLNKGRELLQEKIALIKSNPGFKVMEFGTRRRFSQSWQEEVLTTLANQISQNLSGTSNIYLAMKTGLKPLGTQAHEFLQSFQVLAPSLAHFQKYALETWQEVYKNKLLIALTDVISTDSFLVDFNHQLSQDFFGVRHDSGDPIKFGEKIINHYHSLGMDPSQKVVVFSDGLDIPGSLKIYNHFQNKFIMSFGVGTNLTNDVGVKPLSIVIKMVSCNDLPVAKISDEPAKAICESPEFLQKLKKLFGVNS